MRAYVVMVAALVGFTPGCEKKDTAERDERNKACDEARAEGATEARAWLDPSATDHMGFEVDKGEMRELSAALYAAGATEVLVGWSELEDDSARVEIGGLFIVTLPDDKATRSQVFAEAARIRELFEADPEKDVGQQCVIIGLD
jgi:hypothetical protein